MSRYPGQVEVAWFKKRAKCGKYGSKDVDVRPNWKEGPGMPEDWRGRSAWEN